MSDKSNASSTLMEDLKSLNDIEEAQITPEMQAKWHAALTKETKARPTALRALWAAAAVLVYLFGGTAAWRAVNAPSPALNAEAPPILMTLQSGYDHTQHDSVFVEDAPAAESAAEAPAKEAPTLMFTATAMPTFSPSGSTSAAEREQAETQEAEDPDIIIADTANENDGFFASMGEFLKASLPYAAIVLITLTGIAVIVKRRKTE